MSGFYVFIPVWTKTKRRKGGKWGFIIGCDFGLKPQKNIAMLLFIFVFWFIILRGKSALSDSAKQCSFNACDLFITVR